MKKSKEKARERVKWATFEAVALEILATRADSKGELSFDDLLQFLHQRLAKPGEPVNRSKYTGKLLYLEYPHKLVLHREDYIREGSKRITRYYKLTDLGRQKHHLLQAAPQ